MVCRCTVARLLVMLTRRAMGPKLCLQVVVVCTAVLFGATVLSV